MSLCIVLGYYFKKLRTSRLNLERKGRSVLFNGYPFTLFTHYIFCEVIVSCIPVIGSLLTGRAPEQLLFVYI